jgi:hypothetical protein
MYQYIKSWLTATALALALVCTATPARANLVVTIQEDGGPTQTVVNQPGMPTSNGGSATTADYSVTLLSGGASQSPVTQLLSSTLQITNTTGVSGKTLHIVVSDNDFTTPTTPPNIQALSHIGGTVSQEASGANDTLVFQSFVAGTGLGPQTPDITQVGSFKNDQSGLITMLTSPFTITQTLDLTLNGLNDTVNYASSTTLTPVPEPSSWLIACVGVLGMAGAGLWRRKSLAVVA